MPVGQVFGNMMCNFSSAFNAAYESVGRNLTQMPPRADGRMNITASHTAQALFVAVTCHPHIPTVWLLLFSYILRPPI